MGQIRHRRAAISTAHARLGSALRHARESAGLTTRSVPKGDGFYSSGHISLVEAGAVAASPELVETYGEFGKCAPELRALLELADAARQAAGRSRRQGGRPRLSAPPQDPAEVTHRHQVQEHYTVLTQETDYRFDTTGAIAEMTCSAAIRAKTPGVRLAYSGFTYPADPRPGVLSIEPVSGAPSAHVRESASGAIAAYFDLGRELHPDDEQAHTLVFRLSVASPVRSAPRLRYFADRGTTELTVRAWFPSPAEPDAVWWFATADVVDAEHRDPDRDLPPSSPGFYARTFDQLVPGWCYGFAWAW